MKELLKLINSLVETSSAIHNQDELGKLSEPSLKAAGLRDLRERVMQITRTGKFFRTNSPTVTPLNMADLESRRKT